MCLANLSHDWTRDQSTKTSLYGNIYDFVVDYKPIVGVDPIYDIHRYLMTKQYKMSYTLRTNFLIK